MSDDMIASLLKPEPCLICEKPTIGLMAGPGKMRLLCAVNNSGLDLQDDRDGKDILDHLQDALEYKLPDGAKVLRIGAKGLSIQLIGKTSEELWKKAGYAYDKQKREWIPDGRTIPQIVIEEAKNLGILVKGNMDFPSPER